MKRILTFGILLLCTLVIYGVQQLTTQHIAAETQTVTTTSDLHETLYNGQYYYYSDYEDLVDQIYQDVYDDLYQQLHDQLLQDLTETFYEQIYDEVQSNLENLLTQDEIGVYLSELEQQIHAVVKIGEDSVFGVTSATPDSTAVGSGVTYKYNPVTEKYNLVTNYHVISNYLFYQTEFPDQTDSISLSIRFQDGSTVPATILGYDTEVDVAVLQFDKGDLDFVKPASFGNIEDVSKGDIVLAVGNPDGYHFYNSVTQGIVSGINRKVENDRYVDYIQHDAAINAGNSGGALFNLSGDLIGINVSKLVTVDIEGMGFAIQIDMLKRVVDRIEDGDLLQHTIMPRLSTDFYWVDNLYYNGKVVLPSITIQLNDYTDLELSMPSGVDYGIIVKTIEPSGTLSGHFQNADLLVKIDDYIIRDKVSFFEHLYDNYESGDVITIYYYAFLPQYQEYSDTLSSKTVALV